MTDQITVSREMLRHARRLCIEVRQQSSPRMVALAMPLWAAINRALEQPAVEAVHEFAETCPYCNFNGRNNCANVADEIRKNGETPGSGHCSNYQVYGKRTPPTTPLTIDQLRECLASQESAMREALAALDSALAGVDEPYTELMSLEWVDDARSAAQEIRLALK